MEVNIKDVIIISRNIHLPDQCPHCDAKLEAGNDILCEQMVWETQRATLGESDDIAEWHESEKDWDGDVPVNWLCGACQENLTVAGANISITPQLDGKVAHESVTKAINLLLRTLRICWAKDL